MSNLTNDETKPPFKANDIIEVIKTKGPGQPQQVRITRLWWGTETGQWCVVVSDVRTGKEYHSFADNFQYPRVAGATTPAPVNSNG